MDDAATPFVQGTIGTIGDVPVVRLRGELDLATAPALRDLLHATAERSPARLVVDLSEVSFLGCAGIAELVACRHRVIDTGGRVTIACCGRQLRRVLDLAGVTALFDWADSITEPSDEER